MKTCIYCGFEKADDLFDLEHIWPDALGGNALPDLWRSREACKKCNSAAGLFVDGAFIRSWLGSAERAFGAREYLSPEHPHRAVLPLHYRGVLVGAPTRDGEIAEYWSGPCDAIILHFRPNDNEELWAPFAGGDPRIPSGRAYVGMTSEEPFWVVATLASFRAHFAKVQRFGLKMEIAPAWQNVLLRPPDPNDPVQANDLEVVDWFTARPQGQGIQTKAVFELDLGN